MLKKAEKIYNWILWYTNRHTRYYTVCCRFANFASPFKLPATL